MYLLNNYILSSTSEHVALLKYLLILMLLIHLPFIGMIIGGTLFSVVFNILDRIKQNRTYLNFSKDLINTVAVNRSAGLILGIVPLLVITLIYAQMLYTLELQTVNFLIYSVIMVSLGFLMLYVYKYTFHKREANFIFHISHGILGIFFLCGAYFIFIGSLSLLLEPGEWEFIKNPLHLAFYLNGITKYLLFILSSLAFTGGSILFFFFNWQETRIDSSSDYVRFVKNFGIVTALIFTLLQPIVILWNLVVMPETALLPSIFSYSAIIIFLLLAISYMLYAMLKNSEKKFGTHVFILFLLTFLITILNDQVTSGNSIKEKILLLTYKADEMKNELEIKRGMVSGVAEVNEKTGESVFRRICSQCHRFDRRLVGPPLSSVLPKYESKEKDLLAFIKSPYKKNAGYPSMPKLGLKEEEIASVAKYVLKRLKDESKQ